MADKVTNFEFLKREPEFNVFADAAIAADKLLPVDVISSVIRCRQAMEIAIKWIYSVDESLSMPYQATLDTLLKNSDFRDLVDNNQLLTQMDFIRKLGNRAVHESKNVSREQAELCLHNLWRFLQFVMFCYSRQYSDNDKFDTTLYQQVTQKQEVLPPPPILDVDLQKLMAENAALKSELTALRTEKQPSYIPQPMDISEFTTRKVYIDTMLQDVGWVENRNWQNEVELVGMPNASGVGYADYVLWGDDGRPLAVVEAKKTCVDVSVGRQQAKLYADLLEQKYGRRPVVFLTNGFETRIIDNRYPERRVSFIYSKRDLEKLFNLQSFRTSLKHIHINRDIAGRYYQEQAIKAVCNDFDTRNRRKALLVMATGSGKTRTVIELCDVLLQHGWVKHILFLADRNSLVTQAKRSFTNLLPNLDLTNLCESREHCNAACVFSTYQTMINCIDSVTDEEGKLFSPGHFDLVICDEAHRSIYNKYQDIFTYFDAPLVGLTATPKDEIDKNTYEIFELENGVPTYGYDLAQAVKDGYLVDFLSIETELKFLSGGIVYDELSEEDKKEYEATFTDEDGNMPVSINASALNEWIFNRDTIRQVLNTLMTKGIKIDYGQNIGKTVIFAKSHEHAEKIKKVFDEEYPHLPGYAMVIDHQTNYVQSAIDEFSDPKQLPQIAISVDMLDTGIDVPEVLNLVFFKKVLSKAKFWQMIGRGTRLCPGLLDGNDKERFYIFDFCGNFEFFRMKGGNDVPLTVPLQGAIFHLKAQMAYKLQDLAYQTDQLIAFRQSLANEMVKKVQELNRDNFSVRQHLKHVEIYSDPESYTTLTYEDTLMMRDELVPLITPDGDEATAVRFDALLYGIELACLAGKPWGKRKSDLMKKVQGIAGVANIPEIIAQKDLIDKILHTDYISTAGISDFEYIRKQLRDLIKYIPKVHLRFDTNLDDEILIQNENESGGIIEDGLQNYKAKAEFYIRQHMDDAVIAKLRSNIPLTNSDIQALEQVLWNELGSKEEYEKAFGSIPLGEFVRSITGLDMNAAKQAFAAFLDDASLNSQQIYFVNQIIEYIVHNGIMKDLSVLQEAPFSDFGDISEVFTDLSVWDGIYNVIASINANAIAA